MIIIIKKREFNSLFSTNLSISRYLFVGQWSRKPDLSSFQLTRHPFSIGNSFIYAVAEEAGLEKVWCIIADSSDETVELTKVLSGEVAPKINLSTATRDEIKAALQYLIEKPGTDIKSVKLLVATDRIDEAPRQYWKTLDPITNLKCLNPWLLLQLVQDLS